MGMPVGPLLDAGILQMAVISKYAGTSNEGSGDSTARELFEWGFEVITADTESD